MNKKSGFTLAEILITIAIVSILIILLVPRIINIFDNSKKEVFLNSAKSIMKDCEKKNILTNDSSKKHLYYSPDSNPLDTTITDIKYCIAYDDEGKLNKIIMYDEKYYLSATSTSSLNEFTTDDISNLNNDSVLNCGTSVNIILDYNDGSGIKDNKTVYFGYKYGGLPAKSRENYEFLGWYTEKDKKGDAINHESIVNIDKDHTLYGKWKEIKSK